MMLISLEYASDHLRRDTTDDDADLTRKIEAASQAVITYLGDGADAYTDSAGEVFPDSNGVAIGVPDDIRFATALLVAEFYSNAQSARPDPQFGYGYFPAHVLAILFPYRDPVGV